ncbi:hypothetical protein DL96DRAFT_1681722 [Flagelloscypha sp. PMI_526]|nr:hypothetical protein DL96DRAFT_1681722 [Flagelloscypha sp. PMI_526]
MQTAIPFFFAEGTTPVVRQFLPLSYQLSYRLARPAMSTNPQEALYGVVLCSLDSNTKSLQILAQQRPPGETGENADGPAATILLLVAAIVSLAVALPASTPVRIQQLSSTEPGLCQMMYSYWTGGTPPYHLQLVDMNSLEVLQDIGIKKGHGNGHHFNWQIQVVPSRYVVLSITDSTRVRAVSEPFLIEMTGKEKCKYDRSPLDKDYYGYWYSSTELHPDRPKPSTPELLHFPMDGILRTCKPTKFEWWGGQSPYRIEIVGADNDELLEDLWIVIYDNRGGWIRTWTPDFVLKQGRVRVKITDVNGYIVSSQPFTIVNDEPSTCHPKTLALREPWHSTQSPLPTTTGDAAFNRI